VQSNSSQLRGILTTFIYPILGAEILPNAKRLFTQFGLCILPTQLFKDMGPF